MNTHNHCEETIWPKTPKEKALDILYKRLETCDATELEYVMQAIADAVRIQDTIPYFTRNLCPCDE